MPTPASIRKHPIHPMLVGIPIGLWVFAVVADLVHMGGGGPAWKEVAWYCIGGGIIGALLAAVPGLVDLTSISAGNVRKVALPRKDPVFGRDGPLLQLWGKSGRRIALS